MNKELIQSILNEIKLERTLVQQLIDCCYSATTNTEQCLILYEIDTELTKLTIAYKYAIAKVKKNDLLLSQLSTNYKESFIELYNKIKKTGKIMNLNIE